jgi:hypothetical protein
MNLPEWIGVYAWVIPILAVWEGTWKAIALWRAARNGQLAWFICIIIFNTVGILPIIYILWFSRKKS